ncbi:MAG: type II toxin-antitoxin system RelE/ParE family toxin [Chitinophagales bacterium]|nr:type II toxin-antitoxin system RelE/ParE family toxin [Chitinophagales bacterium]
MVQINWTDDAKLDLKNIFEFISKESNYYAELSIVRIIERVEILQNNPEIGKVIRELNNPKFREILYNHYRIMYKVISESQVDILNIFHSSRNFESNFE